MKRFYVTAVIAGAMFFSVGSATAQETEESQSQTATIQTATEQTEQKDEYNRIEAQELPDEVRQAVERDYQGATIVHTYSLEKDGENRYKIVIATKDGQSQELYGDAQGNWIQKDGQK